ncbi:MAG: hypothetical protein RL385_935 [Pseudomonadota bacterium]|jgi:hypothetical protein
MEELSHALGRLIADKYRLDAVLGVGGMGAVFRATQLSVNRPVAVKLIQGPLLKHPEVEKRFRREAEAMARLRHPASVRLFDFGATNEGELYMVMELLEGRDLAAHLAQRGSLPAAEALAIAKQILLALSEAHAQGIVHRDLKPANVFMAELHGGEIAVKVMDFGIAGIEQAAAHNRLTRTGTVLGTPAYMSPEQAQGHAVDGRSDLYALGVLLFEMITGRVPFTGDSAVSLLLAQVSFAPPRLQEVLPDHPELVPLQPLLDALLQKAPGERPQNAQAALAIVDGMLGGLGQVTTQGASVRSDAAGARFVDTAPMPHAEASSAFGARSTVLGTGVTGRLSQQAKRLALGGFAFLALVGVGYSLGGTGSPPTSVAPAPLRQDPSATYSVQIASAPAGAKVVLDGVVLGTTPYRFEFRKPQRVRIEKNGYRPEELELNVATEPNTVVQLESLAAGEPAPSRERVESGRPRVGRRVYPPDAGPTLSSAAEPSTEPLVATVSPDPTPPPAVPQPAVPAAPVKTEGPSITMRAAEPVARPAPAPTPPPNAKPPSISEAMRSLAQATATKVTSIATRTFRNVTDTKRAYREGRIDERAYEDTIRSLKLRRSERIKAEKQNLKAGSITRDEYERRVNLIDAEYEGR